MNKTAPAKIYTHAPQGEPDSAVILLHGVGSNGRDLISLAPEWKGLGHTVFLSPDAPFACDMVPPGYPDSYQWFSLQNRDPAVMLRGLQDVTPLVHQLIDSVAEQYALGPEKISLAGFSQGTMTALYAGPRYGKKLAGILGYSGALIEDPSVPPLYKPPVHLIHGAADDVVPVEALHHAKERLQSGGFSVEAEIRPGLAHSIDLPGIRSGEAFMRRCFYEGS